jgi:hypothetical protein
MPFTSWLFISFHPELRHDDWSSHCHLRGMRMVGGWQLDILLDLTVYFHGGHNPYFLRKKICSDVLTFWHRELPPYIKANRKYQRYSDATVTHPQPHSFSGHVRQVPSETGGPLDFEEGFVEGVAEYRKTAASHSYLGLVEGDTWLPWTQRCRAERRCHS